MDSCNDFYVNEGDKIMSIPTEGEEYAKLIEYIRKAQESAAMLAHLCKANDKSVAARGWLVISEQMKRMQRVVTQIASGKLQ